METRRVKLQLGCGLTRPGGWINTDSSLNSFAQQLPVVGAFAKRMAHPRYLQPAKYLDIRGRWPFEDGTVDVVYASHVFEHLSKAQGQHFLAESRRVLRKGGAIRLVLPDMYAITKRYVSEFEGGVSDASAKLLYEFNMHHEQAYEEGRNILKRLVNAFQGYPHTHKFMYDVRSLSRLLEESGFSQVHECARSESAYLPEVADVEGFAAAPDGTPSFYVEAISA